MAFTRRTCQGRHLSRASIPASVSPVHGANRQPTTSTVAATGTGRTTAPRGSHLHAAATVAVPNSITAAVVELLKAGSGPVQNARLALLTDEEHVAVAALLQSKLQAAWAYQQRHHATATTGVAVQQMQDLYRCLQQLRHQRAASPAMRLLDAVLLLLSEGPSTDAASAGPIVPVRGRDSSEEEALGGSEHGPGSRQQPSSTGRGPSIAAAATVHGGSRQLVPSYEHKRILARSRLRDAFIEAAAAAAAGNANSGAGEERRGLLAEEAPWAPATEVRASFSGGSGSGGHGSGAVEAVPVADFIREATAVLEQAERQQRDLKRAIAVRHRAGGATGLPAAGGSSAPAGSTAGIAGGNADEALRQAIAVYDERCAGIAQLEDVLAMAQSLRGARASIRRAPVTPPA